MDARVGIALGQLRPHDSGSRILLAGAVGILLILGVDTVLGPSVQHESAVAAFQAAARTIATVGPAVVEPERASYMIFAALAMLITIGLTAMFTAGIVEHLLSGRHVGLVGRRVLPQRGHVVVVGMGQVGVRLAAELKALGLGVVGIERDISAPNLVTARALGIPVHVGDAARRRVLRRVRADRAVALCAAGSDELDNVAVAVTARAVSPTTACRPACRQPRRDCGDAVPVSHRHRLRRHGTHRLLRGAQPARPSACRRLLKGVGRGRR